MRILLYEFNHAGGWRHFGWDTPANSLRREGAAMLAAVAEDFRRLADVEVLIATDEVASCATTEQCATGGLSASVEGATDCSSASALLNQPTDWTLIIAPETGGALVKLGEQVAAAGGKLLGPSSEFIRLTSDKHATAEYLAAAGVPVPIGRRLPARAPLPCDFVYPAVLKPLDGAGSQETWFVESPDAECGDVVLPRNHPTRRLEQFCPGQPASVAFLCGPGLRIPLFPCRQRLSDDGRFQYLGGDVPLAPHLARRAIELADRALAALPAALGYVGVDLILADASDGSEDRVIEVNPRLTTSYVGLRALCHENLARAMLDAALGDVPKLSWQVGAVEFDSAGRVRRTR